MAYMHTPVEVLALGDVENAVRLLAGLVFRIGSREEFIPN